MKSPRVLFLLAALCSMATFGFGQEPQSAQGKKDCCANDAAGCTSDDSTCCAAKAACGANGACAGAGEACCKDATTCGAKDTTCCDANGQCLDQHAEKAAPAKTAAPAASATTTVTAYLPIADALATDDFDKARHAAADLARVTKASGDTAVYLPTVGIVHAPDLAAAREAFKHLSAVVVPLAASTSEFVVMTCPMAKADWVQSDAKVRNPYYGSAMLTCGAPKKAMRVE